MTICNDHLTCQDDCAKCEKAIGFVRGYLYDAEFHAYEVSANITIKELCKGVK